MSDKHRYLFKIASHDIEFQQIHHLNYETFVKEIPQHHANEAEMLIDPFNSENTYIICLKESQLIGMIAVRDKRPFSLDKKIGPVEEALPFKVNGICEIRLLSVAKEHRANGRVFAGLAQFLARYCLKKGYEVAVISGTVRQLKLYGQMGFKPFAQLVGTEEALYQPMYLTKATFDESLAGRILKPTVSFLPGPVQIHEHIVKKLAGTAVSHRSQSFIEKMKTTRMALCELTNSRFVEIMLGTGTLANDMIAAQLSLLGEKGLILTNGEFGERLMEHANGFGLAFDYLKKDWGEPFTEVEVLGKIAADTRWIWFVHSETSTGMLNDLEMLKQISAVNNIKLCVDCISSIGAVPLDLSAVYLASGVSGKAIGAFTGLSFVFHQHEIEPSRKLPKYLDLGLYCKHDSIPYSHSSNLLDALAEAVKIQSPKRYQEIQAKSQALRDYLTGLGLTIITDEEHASPTIVTVELPEEISSLLIGEAIAFQGYQLHYESGYLRERNWLQIATVGDYTVDEIMKMLTLFGNIIEYELTIATKKGVRK